MTDRLFQITYILMNDGSATCSNLAERFGVSTRTILRDVEKLSLSGVPVFMKQGKGGGIGILKDYVLSKEVFSDDEKNQILSSMQALEETSFGKEKETLEKLRSLFGKNAKASTDWIEIEFSSWSASGKMEGYFDKIKSAILENKIISINYASTRKAPTERKVRPLKLCFKGYAWYLYGFCYLHNAYRFFKLSRIIKLEVTEERFEPEKVGKVLTGGIWNDTTNSIVILKVKKDYVWRASEEMKITKFYKNGDALAELSYKSEKEAVAYILSYGSGVEVVKPETLRERVLAEVEKIKEKYK